MGAATMPLAPSRKGHFRMHMQPPKTCTCGVLSKRGRRCLVYRHCSRPKQRNEKRPLAAKCIREFTESHDPDEVAQVKSQAVITNVVEGMSRCRVCATQPTQAHSIQRLAGATPLKPKDTPF